jgi:hypothetical protein
MLNLAAMLHDACIVIRLDDVDNIYVNMREQTKKIIE